MREYLYRAPATLEELFSVVSADCETAFLAGGTDLVPKINLEREEIPFGQKKPLNIIWLGKLGLNTIEEKNGELLIGACTTLKDILNSSVVKEKLPVLIQTVSVMSGVSVRNTATLGGNIMNASPAADLVPSLMVLDSQFVLNGPAGERRVSASEFFTGPGETKVAPGEILAAVAIPISPGAAAFQKIGRRKAETLSVINAAAYVEVENGVCQAIRIAVGSAAPTVVRCEAVEKALIGKALTEETVKEAASKAVEAISPIDDIRSTAWYRKKVAPVVVSRAIGMAAAV